MSLSANQQCRLMSDQQVENDLRKSDGTTQVRALIVSESFEGSHGETERYVFITHTHTHTHARPTAIVSRRPFSYTGLFENCAV